MITIISSECLSLLSVFPHSSHNSSVLIYWFSHFISILINLLHSLSDSSVEMHEDDHNHHDDDMNDILVSCHLCWLWSTETVSREIIGAFSWTRWSERPDYHVHVMLLLCDWLSTLLLNHSIHSTLHSILTLLHLSASRIESWVPLKS